MTTTIIIIIIINNYIVLIDFDMCKHLIEEHKAVIGQDLMIAGTKAIGLAAGSHQKTTGRPIHQCSIAIE